MNSTSQEQNGSAGRPQNPHHERSCVRHQDHQDVCVGDPLLGCGHRRQEVGRRETLCVLWRLIIVTDCHDTAEEFLIKVRNWYVIFNIFPFLLPNFILVLYRKSTTIESIPI